jgi:hypothetical protein
MHGVAHAHILACIHAHIRTYLHAHFTQHAFIYTFTLVNIPACTHANKSLLRLAHARRHARAQPARAPTRIHTCTVGKDDMHMHTCVPT